jgi:hypothetical protein
MTEDEAKTKWCPAVRWADGWFNRPKGSEHARCIASECMAWRATTEQMVKSTSQSGDLRAMVGRDGWRLANGDHAYAVTIERDTGYCGLAGKP